MRQAKAETLFSSGYRVEPAMTSGERYGRRSAMPIVSNRRSSFVAGDRYLARWPADGAMLALRMAAACRVP
jgi:hypothetical protein